MVRPLKLTVFETSIKSLRLAWINHVLNANPALWKAYLKYLSRDYGGLNLSCNYNINDFKIDSQFYTKMLKWWYNFSENFAQDLLGKEKTVE